MGDTLEEQAKHLEHLLPAIMRKLFTLNPDHPASELPMAQLRVCVLLQGGHKTFSAISAELGISVSAATQLADRLEKVGLVERVPGSDDRRTKYLCLTPHGVEMMRSRRETRVERAQILLAQLTEEQRLEVLQTLTLLRDVAAMTAPTQTNEDPLTTRQEQ